MDPNTEEIDETIFNRTGEQNLEAEEFDDGDSALGSDAFSTTTSLSESVYNYRKEHGRTYHAYKDGQYVFPNDDREADRLDLQHHMFNLTYNCLHLAPLQNPKNALDIGTGTGIWAVDFADQYPDCQVLGIDLSPGQPSFIPPNLRFIIDDAEDEWVYPDTQFDYIHLRLMAGCFVDPMKVVRQAYEHLAPGGYIEFQDYGLPLKCADGTLDGTHLKRWGELLCQAAANLGRPMGTDVSAHYRKWMEDIGFVDIEERHFMWPSNAWPKDPYMKELGRWNQVNILDGLEGFCLALLIRGLGWRKEEVDVFVAQVTNDIKDKRIHGYYPMPVAYGRKPFDGERRSQPSSSGAQTASSEQPSEATSVPPGTAI
ncbi:methyltransferase domain-containing protein 31 [Elsinoe australis]|uniref:Methyltransferase domain-containing protein 31 n=1 Tax=Elsinoe australis TaxID=40998 RepID=A0A4U7B2L4_9PEZI|nr:methyltransferase domain-containing protein 31 [Elsinoe australis]